MKPKRLKDRASRDMARWTRDRQWRFMERIAEHGTLWFCVWNKIGRLEAADEWRDGLITGLEIVDWVRCHRSWFRYGHWSEERYARPVSLKPAGRRALKQRWRYDAEPVNGGLVEPGWTCVPAARKASPDRLAA